MRYSKHLRKNALALSLVLAAVGPSAAGAKQGSHASTRALSRQPAAQVIRISSRGFDWGDAGIGAAAGVGLSMLAVGGGLLIGGTRRRNLISGEATGSSVEAPMGGPPPLARASAGNQKQEAQ